MKHNGYPALFLILALLLAGCNEKPGEKVPGQTVAVQGVTFEPVTMATVPETVAVTGTVQARNSAAVLARVAGSVSSLKVREGDRVRKGQVIALLEAQESLSGATAATAAADEAIQGVAEAQSRKKLAD